MSSAHTVGQTPPDKQTHTAGMNLHTISCPGPCEVAASLRSQVLRLQASLNFQEDRNRSQAALLREDHLEIERLNAEMSRIESELRDWKAGA